MKKPRGLLALALGADEREAHAAEWAAGASLEQVSRKTGCGTTCTACLPDLRRYLSSRS